MIQRLLRFGIRGGPLPILLAILTGTAAAEGRPWLCRDKPVFSASKPVQYEVASQGARHWRIFFMQFEPGAAHDGFMITQSQDVSRGVERAAGNLPSGRYFAVALYQIGGDRWVCPARAEEQNAKRGPGEISRLCYSDDEDGACRVTLRVSEANGTTH